MDSTFPARSRRRAACLALLVGLAVSLAPVGTASAASVSPGPAQVAAGTVLLDAVACLTATDCVAAGSDSSGQGLVVPVVDGVPGVPKPVPGSLQLQGLACANTFVCEAVGTNAAGQGIAVPVSAGYPGAVQIVAGTSELSAVACPSTAGCLAVGTGGPGQAVVVPITSGSAGAAQVVPGLTRLRGVSCASAALCEAAGRDAAGGAVVALTSGVPGAVQPVPGTQQLVGISCPSTSSCTAVGFGSTFHGTVVPVTGGVPGPVAEAATNPFMGVACVSTSVCLALGNDNANVTGAVFPVVDGVPSGGQLVTGSTVVYAGACATTSACQLVGQSPGGGMVATLAVTGAVPAAAPSVQSVSPPSGPVTGGQSVTVLGTGFTGATAVVVGGTSAPFTPGDDTRLTFTTPPHAEGAVDVQVVTPAGTSATTASDVYTYAATAPSGPVVSGLVPDHGPTTGGTRLTVTGTGLSGATQVTVGGQEVPLTPVSDTSLQVTTPPHPAGRVDVRVTTPAGTSPVVLADVFTYQVPVFHAPLPEVSSVTPSSGSRSGGDQVLVTGAWFSGATQLLVDGQPATFTLLNSAHLVLTTPPHAPGAVDLQVVTPAGTSAVTAAAVYTYTTGRPLTGPAPHLSSVAPSSVPQAGPRSVTLRGERLDTVTQVLLDGTPIPFTSSVLAPYVGSNTLIPVLPLLFITGLGGVDALLNTGEFDLQVYPPAHALGPAQLVVVGTGGVSNTLTLTFNAVTSPPHLDSAGPSTVPPAGSTPVLLRGARLDTVTQLLLDGVPVAFAPQVLAGGLVFNTGEFDLQFVPPPHAPGTARVVAVGVAGASNALTLNYAAVPAPRLASLSPSSVPQAGPTLVVVRGDRLNSVTQVLLDGSPVPFTPLVVGGGSLIDSGEFDLQVNPPPHAPGQVRLTVVGSGGTSNSLVLTYRTVTGAPHLDGVSPGTVPQAGSTEVVLHGTRLDTVTQVLVDGSPVPFRPSVVGPGLVPFDTGQFDLRLVPPAHAPGTVTIVVVGPGGRSNPISLTYRP